MPNIRRSCPGDATLRFALPWPSKPGFANLGRPLISAAMSRQAPRLPRLSTRDIEERGVKRAKKSIVDSIGQTWKLRAGFAFVMLGFAVLIYGNSNLDRPFGIKALCVGIGLGLGSALITCLVVRCPRCSARWLWMAVSEQPQTSYLKWLAEQTVCPRCRYPSSVDSDDFEDAP